MAKFILSTDSSSDLLRSELAARDVRCIPLTYTVDGVTRDGLYDSEDEYKAFYAGIRGGRMPTTSLINEYLYREYFSGLLGEGYTDIVHLSLSGGLSGSYVNAVAAADALMSQRPDVYIYVVDSLGATQAQRITLEEGITLRDAGRSPAEIYEGMRQCVATTQVYIVVDDLFHLKRGGRLSGAAAVIGSALKLKPIVILDDKGKLEVIAKVTGSKKALKFILDKFRAQAVEPAGQTVYVASADCPEYAAELQAALETEFGCKTVVDWIGPVIGSHTGAGTLGLVYRGKNRLSK